MTRTEAKAVIAALVTLRESATDEQALSAPVLYPAWRSGVAYVTGQRVLHNAVLYKALQDHTSQETWTPEAAPSLWTEICETHAGTLADPIPYDGNMELSAGLYYVQNGVTYLCNRNTGQPVYNALADLVGLYVEVAV